MKPLEVLARNVRLLREQVPMTQVQLADAVGVDSTAIVRIEKAKRDVRVHELLELAAAMNVTPVDLVAPVTLAELDNGQATDAKTLTVGGYELDTATVRAWFAGDPSVVRWTMFTVEDLLEAAARQQAISGLVAEVRFLAEVIERQDKEALALAVSRAHEGLSALVERLIPDEERQRIRDEYGAIFVTKVG